MSGNGSPAMPQTTWHDTKYAIGRLTSSEFLNLLRTVFTELESQLARVKGVHTLVRRGLETVPTTEDYREQVLAISAEALYNVCEESQDRVARLLRSRNEQHARLVANELATLFDTCMNFATTVDGIAGRQCHGLRPTVLQQAKQFLDTFHANRIASLGLLLDNEEWSQAEIVSEFQDITDQITAPPPKAQEEEKEKEKEKPPGSPERSGSPVNTPGTPANENSTPLSPLHTPQARPSSPTPLTLQSTPSTPGATIATPSTTPAAASAPATPATPTSPMPAGPRNVIMVHGESYKVVNTSLMLLKIVSDYLHCMALVPALSTDVVHRVVEVLSLALST